MQLVEPAAARRAVALSLGFDGAVSPAAEPPRADADVVIEASGRPECLDAALLRARDEGVVVVASFYGQRVAPVSLGSDFHRRRLTLRSSQVSRLPPGRAPGWSYARRFGLVTDLLADPRLDALLEPALPFDEAPAVYARLARDPGDGLQTVFRYRS